MKYLEIPDFHFNKQWAEISVSAAKAVAEEATLYGVDFIALVGDFFDAPIYASDKGGMKIAKKIIKSWTDICPVVTIEGTPSHDAPGCYGLFDDVVILEPMKVYGYYPDTFVKSQKRFEIREVNKPEGLAGILFGIPELTKSNLQAKLTLSGEEANAEVINLFKDYVLRFIAPMRLKYKDIPAAGFLHGNVSDSARSNETDIILKASDIVIYTEDLEPAGLDRWSLGHIHTPWESKKINAGYAGYPGVDRNPWGKRDFIPAMNLITDGKISRLPYGTPERRKVKTLLNEFIDPEIAYWIDTDNPDEQLPDAVHPWSRITYSENKTETRRVTEEEAAGAKTLWDLFCLIADPKPSLKKKVDLITETIPHAVHSKKDVRVEWVKVKGCKLFKNKTIELDISKIPEGLNLINGENGSGKSSLLSFCHPYPIVIGKDKGKTLKTFFSSKDSMIEKKLTLNGQEHRHLITIKAAHTQTPKTECYITIDGIPQLDKGTFDEMMEACENLYGSILDYRITSFCEQPQQATSNLSGLMSAKPIDARNLVQTIAGVDREAEKRFALDLAGEEEKAIKETEIKIETLTEGLPDGEKLSNEKVELEALLESNQAALKTLEVSGKDDKKLLELNYTLQRENHKKILEKKNCDEQLADLIEQSTAKWDEIKVLTDLSKGTDSLKQQLKSNDKILEEIAEIQLIEDGNNTLKMEYLNLKSDYNDLLSENQNISNELQATITAADNSIKVFESRIELINKPCEHCGKLPTEADAEVKRAGELIKLEEKSKKETTILKEALISPDIPIEPEYVTIPDKPESLTAFELQSINEDLLKAEHAEVDIKRLEQEISKMDLDIVTLERTFIVIDETIDEKVCDLEEIIEAARKLYSDSRVEIESIKGKITALNDKIEALKTQEATIKALKEKLNTEDLEDWKYIAKMLGSDKIPALELDMVLSSIDTEATRNIQPFLEGRYSFRTTTQEKGIDRFDIFVTDLETGEEVSLFVKNPGHKAFFSDAYIKALIRQRNQRTDRRYSPIIFDESDAPIKENWISMYYEINQRYFEQDATKVLIVSQKDSAVNYMSNSIEIEQLKQ